jgi:hypothetical protein
MAWNTSSAAGAMPPKAPPLAAPDPQARPATWVPCPLPRSAASSTVARGAANVAQLGFIGQADSARTRPARSGCIARRASPPSRPVSATEITSPPPSNCQAAGAAGSAPMLARKAAAEPSSVDRRGASTSFTPGRSRSLAASPANLTRSLLLLASSTSAPKASKARRTWGTMARRKHTTSCQSAGSGPVG